MPGRARRFSDIRRAAAFSRELNERMNAPRHAAKRATAGPPWSLHLVMMHHRLHVHLVWTTRDRVASLDIARAAYLREHLPIIARQERARVLALGIVTTHLHMLVRLHPTTDIPQLLQRMKGGTAHGINAATPAARPVLRWAKGYSVTSVSPGGLERVLAYVNSQHLHHPTEAIAGWPPAPSLEHVAKATARLMSLK